MAILRSTLLICITILLCLSVYFLNSYYSHQLFVVPAPEGHGIYIVNTRELRVNYCDSKKCIVIPSRPFIKDSQVDNANDKPSLSIQPPVPVIQSLPPIQMPNPASQITSPDSNQMSNGSLTENPMNQSSPMMMPAQPMIDPASAPVMGSNPNDGMNMPAPPSSAPDMSMPPPPSYPSQ